MDTWTIRHILKWAAEDFERRSITSARLDAEVLLAHALGTDRLGLYLDLDRPLAEEERRAFREMITRRRDREPVAYLTGTKEFWSLEMHVDPTVLIPRPDTEVLVEEALERLPADLKGLQVVDVGTGSGCVALAIASERPNLHVLAVDINRRAVALTAHNADRLGLASRVSTIAGDLLEPVGGQVQLVVANLPYIPSDSLETLEPEVSRWEPRRALDGGGDGLRFFRRLIAAASQVIPSGGIMALEVGCEEQAKQVVELFDERWMVLRVRPDLSGVDRVVVSQRK